MTPQLVEQYKALDGKKDRKVEFILIDHDINQRGMDKYLVKSKINFPGLKQSETENGFLTKIKPVTGGLPMVVITDANGKVKEFATEQNCKALVAKIPSLTK